MKHQNISYIICFRDSSQERKNALIFKLAWMWKYFPDIEVIVVEQDVETKLDFELPPNCKSIFIYNPTMFNRSWAFNVASMKSDKELLVFSDSDIFLRKEDYEKCFSICYKFDMCKPNLSFIHNVRITSYEDLTFEILNERKLFTIAGGLIFMRREALLRIGGWDERFEGWGGEDAAMSKLIINRLTFFILDLDTYHIDHDRSQAKKDKTFLYNWNLAQEIGTYEGPSITNYIERLQSSNLGNINKYLDIENVEKDVPAFVLAITTFNRLTYLRDMLVSFLATKSNNATWTIIIADDGSTDGTIDFISNFDFQGVPFTVLENQRCGVHHQVNTILEHLSSSNFDLCFKCDDDLLFRNEGWDKLYWDAIQRTGYEHLIFFDKSWRADLVRKKPIISGNLISNCECENISGAMYTITPNLLNKVGYFDVFNFGFRGVGHQDYSLRCCRAGFNVIDHPFDVIGSNDFIQLQGREKYNQSLDSKLASLLNPSDVRKFKYDLKRKNRVYIPYNESYSTSRDQSVIRDFLKLEDSKRLTKTDFSEVENTDYVYKEVCAEVLIVSNKASSESGITLEKQLEINKVKDESSFASTTSMKQNLVPKVDDQTNTTRSTKEYSDLELEVVLNSLSWKITAPLRSLAEVLKAIKAVFKKMK